MRVLGLLTVSAAMLLLASCGNGGGGKIEESGKTALIGANLEMTGEQATWGRQSKNGMELALEEINARPGQTIKLKMVVEDNKSSPSDSSDAMKRLINQHRVIAVIGAVSSNLTLAAADVAREEKVPLMTHAATAVSITQKGPFVSRICFNDDFQGMVMARFALGSLKAKSAVILVSQGNAYSEGLSKSFRAVFTEGGGKIIDELAYKKGDNDFSTHITTLRKLNPDLVWLPGYHNEVGLILKQAREAGFQAPFLGGDGWDSPELFKLAGPAVKGNYVCNHFDPGDPDPVVREFVQKYEKKFGEKPGAMSAVGYDAMFAMADAVSRSKDFKPSSMKDAINAISGLKGVCGTITLNADRETTKNAVVLETVEDGFKYRETIKADK
jgi:branched-chain amino acid transport system substrate-binding protein